MENKNTVEDSYVPMNLARSSLLSKDVLNHRFMADNNLCSIYGAVDSWKHSLMRVICEVRLSSRRQSRYRTFVSEILYKMNLQGWLLRFGWYTRRKVIHENSRVLIQSSCLQFTKPPRVVRASLAGVPPHWIPSSPGNAEEQC